jgi:hypothetical protein
VCLTAEIVIRSNMYASITWNPNNTVSTDMLSVNGVSETFVHYISIKSKDILISAIFPE